MNQNETMAEEPKEEEPQVAYQRKNLIFEDDFETSNFSQWIDKRDSDEACCSYSLTFDSTKSRRGSQSLRVEHRKSDPEIYFGYRAELSTKKVKINPKGEYWFGFSTFVPNEWSDPTSWHVAWQIHSYPDFNKGENWRSPPLALYLSKPNRWTVTVRSSAREVNSNNTATYDCYDFPLTKGQWTDLVFHVNFTYENSGFLKVYQNGQVVVDHKGPTYYNDENDGYMKMGIYRDGRSAANVRVLNHDEMRVGNSNATYKDVAP